MRYGVIDIGTNSMRLLIAKVENNSIVSRFKALEFTRIGQGTDENGIICDEAIERNIQALQRLNKIAMDNDTPIVSVIATSAVRDASNRQVLLDQAKQNCGLDIEVISGLEEARLGFKGVVGGINGQDGNYVVIDIGGGSTEIILGCCGKIITSTSLNIGAVRLTERHGKSDPLERYQISNIQKDIDQAVEDILENVKNYHIKGVVGIGGTATTMAAINLSMEQYDADKIHGHVLKAEDIQTITNMMLKYDYNHRTNIKGLQPQRADIIPAASMILNTIVLRLGVESIIVSDYDNLEGKIFDIIS